MSAWPGKFVIGITGNIATGKSVVRRMLEHLGAYGIDADALGHRAIAQGAPGYQPVLDTFGKWILNSGGHIDRTKLARIVFADADALERLEEIVHPLVTQGVDLLVRRSKQKVIAIEAIKLIESSLRAQCDSIWVTYAPHEIQLARLMQKRRMSEVTASQRIAAQPLQEEKIGVANIVIRNDGSFEDTWQQVVTAWQKTAPMPRVEAQVDVGGVDGEIVVRRAGPRQADEIAAFISQMSGGSLNFSRGDIMEAFGEKAFMMINAEDRLVGLAGWQVENLIARTDDVYLEHDFPFAEAMQALTGALERASRELQCEISLLFLPPSMARKDNVWRALGYQQRSIASLRVRAWQEAAAESMSVGSKMLFKQLRKDRVLRPV
jgi:dephospho-CoA kinase